jgi:DNA-binding CsgD family transcriptional regulator
VLLDEGLAILRQLQTQHALTQTLSHLGFLEYLESRHESARALFREGLELARRAGDQDAAAELVECMGRTYHAEGDFDAAIRCYLEAEQIWREIGQGHRLAMVLNNFGSVLTLRGELGAARTRLAEALWLAQKIGNRRRLAFTLEAIATLAAQEGEVERGVRLHAVATRAVAEMGASLAQPIYVLGERQIDRAGRMLGAVVIETARAAGQAMPLADAVDEARTWLAEHDEPAEVAGPLPALAAVPAPASTSRPAPPPALAQTPAVPTVSVHIPTAPGGALSPRELEVAALVARGMTNRQIAAELIITEGTAANHVKHILARLTLDSRVQIASWATERGLHVSAHP